MNVGDYLNPIYLGHSAIDIKTMCQEHGYIMPQGSVAKLPTIPAEVQTDINNINLEKEKYVVLEEHKSFVCPFCKESNGSNYRQYEDIVFLTCGSCHKIVEVK